MPIPATKGTVRFPIPMRNGYFPKNNDIYFNFIPAVSNGFNMYQYFIIKQQNAQSLFITIFIHLLQFNGIQTNNVYMNELALRAL